MMSDSVAAQTEHDRLVNALSYACGQLAALNADHRVHVEFPGLAALLRRNELHRGFEDGRAWLRDLEARTSQSQKLPEHRAKRGAVARTAAAFGNQKGYRRQAAS
jgi:hypothetical protein